MAWECVRLATYSGSVTIMLEHQQFPEFAAWLSVNRPDLLHSLIASFSEPDYEMLLPDDAIRWKTMWRLGREENEVWHTYMIATNQFSQDMLDFYNTGGRVERIT